MQVSFMDILNLEELPYQEHDVLNRASIIRKHAGNENSKFYALYKWFLSRDQRIYRNTIAVKTIAMIGFHFINIVNLYIAVYLYST